MRLLIFVLSLKFGSGSSDVSADAFEIFARHFLPEVNISSDTPFNSGQLFTYPVASIRTKAFEHAIVSTTSQFGNYKTMFQKLYSSGSELEILIVAHSQACGNCHMGENQSRANCPILMKGAWPFYLQEFMTSNISYINPHVFVHNNCAGGASSSVFVNAFMEWKQIHTHALNRVDLIIVETALGDSNYPNELWRYGRKGDDAGAQEFEMLMRIIQTLPQQPAVLGIETGYDKGFVREHLKVARPYGIPYLDILPALIANVPGSNGPGWYLSGDCCAHLSVSGQRLAAIYVLYFITLMMNEQEFVHMKFNTNNITVSDLPITMDSHFSRIYENGFPLYVQFAEHAKRHHEHSHYLRYQTLNSGFSYFEDVPGKPGFIGVNTSNSFSLHFDNHVIRRHCKFGGLIVEHLVSYENMGILEVQLILSHENGHTKETLLIDSLRESRNASISETSTVYFNHSRHDSLSIDAVFTVIEANPSRKVNKVKVFHVLLI